MLASLSIRDIVLIDSLSLEGAAGLCALTGETGAGKSILLDALGLALGGRAAAGLVRHGAPQGSVTAVFDPPPGHPVRALLEERGIPAAGGDVILRRVVGADGRSRAFINDEAVGVQLLKEAGALLVEIHGQFETQGLLDPATHRAALDAAAGILPAVAELRGAWDAWRAAAARLEQARAEAGSLELQEDYLRHAVAELEALDPRPGEEEALTETRARLRNAERTNAAFDGAAALVDGEEGALAQVGRAQAVLQKLDAAQDALDALSRARAELEDASFQMQRARASATGAGESLHDVEERYFAIRECAKKHRCDSGDLPRVREELARKLRLATDRDAALADLQKAEEEGRAAYLSKAAKISEKRARAAGGFARAVQAELPDLRLGRAAFRVECERTDESRWGPEGMDQVRFMVATNPGAPAGPLHKIASGGELARFMLALRAVLARTGAAPTLVFDEVDSGIGGAVADAVGERLARLARRCQVLVVTHSPQVAARAQSHWRVEKREEKGRVATRITPLSAARERREEIARMLSGAEITAEARAQADRLLERRDAAA